MVPNDALSYSAMGDVDTIQWRSNHLRDDWSNIHSFSPGDTTGTLQAIDIIHQLEHLPGIDVEGNHTISFRGIKANDSGGHSSSPLISANIMLMDTASAFETQGESSTGLSTTSIAIGVMCFIVIFIVALLVVGAISDKEEGTFAGVDFKTLQDGDGTEMAATLLDEGSTEESP